MTRSLTTLITLAVVLLAGCEREATESTTPTLATPLVERGPNWSRLSAVTRPAGGFAVNAEVPGSIAVGDTLQFTVTSARAGFLHIVQVDASDTVTVLLPHPAFPSNAVAAGSPFTYPPALSNVTLRAQEPVGDSLLAFIVTRQNLPTEQVVPELLGVADQKGLVVSEDAAASWSVAKYTMRTEAAAQ